MHYKKPVKKKLLIVNLCKYVNNNTLQETPQDNVYNTDDDYHINMLICKYINVYNKIYK